jgi:hypothetical protein
MGWILGWGRGSELVAGVVSWLRDVVAVARWGHGSWGLLCGERLQSLQSGSQFAAYS